METSFFTISALPAAAKFSLLAAVAFGAGALNAVAGGGSFLSFPALLGVPLPPVNANATNTVALWPGQIASIVALRRELQSVKKLIWPTVFCSAVGGIAGALTLLFTRQSTFMRMVPWLLLFATILFALSAPVRKWLDRAHPPGTISAPTSFSKALYVWLTIVAFYVGFFGAGAGFLILTVFSIFGFTNFHQLNALKILCNSVANGIAVVTFISARAVFWKECLVMLLFAAAGGYLGGSYSRKVNPVFLRAFVIVTGLLLSIHYFMKNAN